MNANFWNVASTFASILSFIATIWSLVANKWMVFNVYTITFFVLLLISISINVYLRFQNKRLKKEAKKNEGGGEKPPLNKLNEFTDGTLVVKVDYGDKSMVYLTIKNVTIYTLYNTKVEVSNNISNKDDTRKPYLIDASIIKELEPNKSVVKQIAVNEYPFSFSVAIIRHYSSYSDSSEDVFKIKLTPSLRKSRSLSRREKAKYPKIGK